MGHILIDEVFTKLQTLKPNKYTASPDSILAFLIKNYVGVFFGPSAFLFNLAIDNKTFPDCWKMSKIISLFTKDDRSNTESYRPISILNNFAKVFEMVIFDVLYHQIGNHMIANQHGFVQGRSTVTNLMHITQYISGNIVLKLFFRQFVFHC